MAGFHEIIGVKLIGINFRAGYRLPFHRPAAGPAEAGAIHLHYYVKGGASFRFPDHTVTAQAGSALFWEGNTLLERSGLEGRPADFWVGYFIPVYANRHIPFRKSGLPEICTPRNPRAFVRGLNGLLTHFTGKKEGWEQACSMLMLELLRLLPLQPQVVRNTEPAGPDQRLTESRIGDVLDHINEHYKERLGIAELARVARMHPVHFGRLFKKVTGLTPHRYVLEKKVLKAKDFLLHFREPLASTATELGFHDYAHFFRVFTRLTGQGPTAFLKKEALSRTCGVSGENRAGHFTRTSRCEKRLPSLRSRRPT